MGAMTIPPPPAPEVATVVEPPAKPRSWWRRNRLALVALAVLAYPRLLAYQLLSLLAARLERGPEQRREEPLPTIPGEGTGA